MLVAFLEADFVVSRGWLTEQTLVDAVAVGQFTPGPVFTTATFVGYVFDGFPGAIVATLGIFLPSFFFVAVTHRLVPRLREAPWASGFLDGVGAAAVAVMAVVVVSLGRVVVDDAFAWVVLAVAAVVLRALLPQHSLARACRGSRRPARGRGHVAPRRLPRGVQTPT